MKDKIIKTQQKKSDKRTKIVKRLSQIGVGSRRDVKKMIDEGVVKVNGFTISDGALEVSETDKININKKVIRNFKDKTKVYLMNKPKGYITSTKDEKGRATVFDLIPKKFGRLISIGRLDYNTEGLLIFTNDGEYARNFELPTSKIKRVYHVKVFGFINNKKLEQIKNVKLINGVKYDKFDMVIQKIGEPYSTFKITIFEGKNREIRKVMDFFGLKVVKLVRIEYGPYKLKHIPLGQIVEAKTVKEISQIKIQNNKDNL